MGISASTATAVASGTAFGSSMASSYFSVQEAEQACADGRLSKENLDYITAMYWILGGTSLIPGTGVGQATASTLLPNYIYTK
jgi:archaellum component FlaF (FlaF/FlaG flagellin family)